MAQSFSDRANAEQQGQVKVLDAKARQGYPDRVSVPRAGRDHDLHRVLSHHSAVPLAAPALVETHRPAPAALNTSGPRWNPHAHVAAKPSLLRTDDYLHGEALHSLSLRPTE